MRALAVIFLVLALVLALSLSGPVVRAQATETPTATATATASTTPSPTVFVIGTPQPTGTPLPTWTPMPTPAGSCPNIDYAYPIGTRIASIGMQIETISASLSISDSLMANVIISNDPVSIARGFAVVVGEVAWLRYVFTWFFVAFPVIVILQAVRFVGAFEGILERLRKLVEMIPGM